MLKTSKFFSNDAYKTGHVDFFARKSSLFLKFLNFETLKKRSIKGAIWSTVCPESHFFTQNVDITQGIFFDVSHLRLGQKTQKIARFNLR